MKPTPALFVATCLLTIIGRASAGCRDGRNPPPEVCLNTFVWCDPSEGCDFPENVWPIDTDWRGHGMLRDNETYNIAWEGTSHDDAIELQVVFWPTPESRIRMYNDFSYRTQLGANNAYTFEPYELLVEIADSGRFNGTLDELQGMAARMRIQIRVLVTRNGEIIPVDSYLESSYFSIMSWSAAAAADWQRDHAFEKERRRWKLGVGIGVGLGLPISMAATALLTRWMTKRSRRGVIAQRHQPVDATWPEGR